MIFWEFVCDFLVFSIVCLNPPVTCSYFLLVILNSLVFPPFYIVESSTNLQASAIQRVKCQDDTWNLIFLFYFRRIWHQAERSNSRNFKFSHELSLNFQEMFLMLILILIFIFLKTTWDFFWIADNAHLLF